MAQPDVRRLLRFARDLQRANDVDALMRAVQREVLEALGYANAWICIAEPDKAHVRMLSVAGDHEALVFEHAPIIPVAGDAMLEEIMRGDAPVVVVDARTDPRTNKEIVGKLGNRTIVNVPLATIDAPLGALGVGTFGDEGPRPPSEADLEYLAHMASQVSVAIARIRWLAERDRIERDRAAVERRMLVAQKMESLGVLAGGVAHDLNNLLTVILVHARLVGREPLSESQREDVDCLIEAGHRAASLTQQLVGMSRPQPQRLETVDLHAQLHALVEMLGRSLGPSIAIELALSAEHPLCTGDPTQLDQVFMNLAVNARDAMPEGGRLRIETREIEIDAQFVSVHPWAQPGRYVLTTISDTGHGMPPETLERVFEPFFTTKAPGKGTGLGLAVAYGVVRQHGGLLHAYSEPGVGTTMKVFLPQHRATATAAPRASALPGPAPLGSERILVADDDERVRGSLIKILEGAGYTVVAVRDGAEVLTTIARERFDLVLLDAVMPKLNGWTTYSRIRERNPSLPCLFATGYAPELMPDLRTTDMPIEVLAKPFEPEALLRAVRRALTR